MKSPQYKFGTGNLKNNMINVQGPKHEGGGVNIGNNVEVEGGEAIFEGFTFSNRLMTDKGQTYADAAKAISKRLAKDKSDLGKKTLKMELGRLSQSQEQLKATMQAPAAEGAPGEPKKMFLGGAIAPGVGSLINIGRGAFEDARQYDDISLERMSDPNLINLSEARKSDGINVDRNRRSTNATIRGNAGSAGQLLGNTLVNNARSSDDYGRRNAESFMHEENTNAQIKNQVDQFNVGIANQEKMQNFQIGMMNDQNKDAKSQMMWDGIGGLLGSIGGGMDAFSSFNLDKASLLGLTDLSEGQITSIMGDGSLGSMLGFGNSADRKANRSYKRDLRIARRDLRRSARDKRRQDRQGQ